jgi:hypothetical protein
MIHRGLIIYHKALLLYCISYTQYKVKSATHLRQGKICYKQGKKCYMSKQGKICHKQGKKCHTESDKVYIVTNKVKSVVPDECTSHHMWELRSFWQFFFSDHRVDTVYRERKRERNGIEIVLPQSTSYTHGQGEWSSDQEWVDGNEEIRHVQVRFRSVDVTKSFFF